jgi:hypothetical protein
MSEEEQFKSSTIEAQVSVQDNDPTVQVDTEVPADTPVSEEDASLMRFGYTVGVKEDGSFIFDLHGEEKGVVQLLGLTKFAENQINRIQDIALKQGDALLNQGLALIFQEIQVMKRAMGLVPNEPDEPGE